MSQFFFHGTGMAVKEFCGFAEGEPLAAEGVEEFCVVVLGEAGEEVLGEEPAGLGVGFGAVRCADVEAKVLDEVGEAAGGEIG